MQNTNPFMNKRVLVKPIGTTPKPVVTPKKVVKITGEKRKLPGGFFDRDAKLVKRDLKALTSEQKTEIFKEYYEKTGKINEECIAKKDLSDEEFALIYLKTCGKENPRALTRLSNDLRHDRSLIKKAIEINPAFLGDAYEAEKKDLTIASRAFELGYYGAWSSAPLKIRNMRVNALNAITQRPHYYLELTSSRNEGKFDPNLAVDEEIVIIALKGVPHVITQIPLEAFQKEKVIEFIVQNSSHVFGGFRSSWDFQRSIDRVPLLKTNLELGLAAVEKSPWLITCFEPLFITYGPVVQIHDSNAKKMRECWWNGISAIRNVYCCWGHIGFDKYPEIIKEKLKQLPLNAFSGEIVKRDIGESIVNEIYDEFTIQMAAIATKTPHWGKDARLTRKIIKEWGIFFIELLEGEMLEDINVWIAYGKSLTQYHGMKLTNNKLRQLSQMASCVPVLYPVQLPVEVSFRDQSEFPPYSNGLQHATRVSPCFADAIENFDTNSFVCQMNHPKLPARFRNNKELLWAGWSLWTHKDAYLNEKYQDVVVICQ